MVQVETEAPALGRKPSATATPSTLDKRASPRLYLDNLVDKVLEGAFSLGGIPRPKKYIVRLTAKERETCEDTVRQLSGASQKFNPI